MYYDILFLRHFWKWNAGVQSFRIPHNFFGFFLKVSIHWVLQKKNLMQVFYTWFTW